MMGLIKKAEIKSLKKDTLCYLTNVKTKPYLKKQLFNNKKIYNR
tara:strand:- start:279 stop:410 length:132 start_codon:yes stop_codon:yes gene_type:complete